MKELFDRIAIGREALAQGAGDRGNLPASSVATLLALLWHEEREIRQAAARSLPGGDRDHYHEFHYGYFAEAILRELATRYSPAPDHAAERYDALADVLQDLIGQSARDIRGMSGMHYSFLSSALYLALFATCRDAVLAAMRLRSSRVHQAHKQHPIQTLLRASNPDPQELLRSVSANPDLEPTSLVRPTTPPEWEGS